MNPLYCALTSIPSSNVWLDSLLLSAGGVSLDPSSGWLELSIALFALAAMEIVLGIDNVIFISIVTSRLPREQQHSARLIGLGLAMFLRIGLLCIIATIATWTQPLFRLTEWLPASLHSLLANSQAIDEVSLRDLILLFGGMFLIYQSVREIYQQTETDGHATMDCSKQSRSFAAVLMQIAVLDIVFSLDSVITAVGMVDNVPVMIIAVIIAVLCMMFFSGPVSAFVAKHASVKILALSFLLMIGVTLVAEGFGAHFNKNYIYFAMAFALGVEMLNLRIGRQQSSTAAPLNSGA